MPNEYSSEYLERVAASARSSAAVVVPLLMDWISPVSVIDLGCGSGAWLAVFREAGVLDIRGVDGDYVAQDVLEIPEETFTAHDLAQAYTTDRKYDLAISLEVAEHLPEEAAATLVKSLTSLAPVVLFSAAIPHQKGKNHINCHWPTYWANLFAKQDYIVVDTLRYTVWANSRVAWWYRQNAMIYVDRVRLHQWPALRTLQPGSPTAPLHLVHPECFEQWVKSRSPSFRWWRIWRMIGLFDEGHDFHRRPAARTS